MSSSEVLKTSEQARDHSRGATMLALAGPPTPSVYDTMVACASNLERDLISTIVGRRAGGVIATEQELALVSAAVRRSGPAVVVVPGTTPPRIVRRLAAAGGRPVLLARTREPWERVLAATDLRARGLPIVAAGASIAAAVGATSMVIHNVAPAWTSPSALITARSHFVSSVGRRLRSLVRSAARTSPPSSVIVTGFVLACHAILDAAARRDADLLVVGMRRAGAPIRPRCADQVVGPAASNVLVVPIRHQRPATLHAPTGRRVRR